MSNTTEREKTIKELLLGTTWSYLHDNFHKFSEANKIKIALTLCAKDMPTEIKGGFQVTQMPTILKGKDPLNYDIGQDGQTDAPQNP